MKQRGMGARRGAMVATGLAVATSFGLAGSEAASAAAPALKIKAGAAWTLKVPSVPACEADTFNTTTHQFTSDLFKDKGTWSGGGSTINMVWTKGEDKGATFSGTLTKTPKKDEYTGSLGGAAATLVKGALTGC